MSVIQYSLLKAEEVGKIRIMSDPLNSTLIGVKNTSNISNARISITSQKRNVYARDFDVRAPTGHKSIILPENSSDI